MCAINRDRVVFVDLVEMDTYEGEPVTAEGGGLQFDKHEIFNFLNDSGKCYGFTPMWGNINISRIAKSSAQDEHGRKYVDDVFVVFTCSRKNSGRLVCGFYQHARVYAKAIHKKKERKLTENGKVAYASYNLVCDAADAVLIPKDERTKKLPRAGKTTGSGYGRSHIWYVDTPERQTVKNEILDYIEAYANSLQYTHEYIHEDEVKYYHEGKKGITQTPQRTASRKAREKCIRRKGCYCNVCGFDFEKEYGALGKGYIEVHHITPIGVLSTAKDYKGTDPEKDLIPLCPNCHSMIHKQNPPYHPDTIKEMRIQQRADS